MPCSSVQPSNPSVVAEHILSLVHAPPQPQLLVANSGTAITAHWQSVGPLVASYVIEVRESTSSASNRFTRHAPSDAADSLELCIQGLEPGRSYIACVRSVAQDGAESASSVWSSWLTLPMVLQPFEVSGGNMPAPHMPSLTPQPAMSPDLIIHKMYDLPLQKPEKQMPVIGSQPPPEVTGQEEIMMLYLD